MKLYSVTFCILFIGNVQICSSLPKKLCDIRIWYLNLIANDVFSSARTTKQLELKDSIESLVLSTPDKPEARIKECHVLEIYNGLLKEELDFDISRAKHMRNYEVKDNDNIDIDNKPKQNDDVNTLIETDDDIVKSSRDLKLKDGDSKAINNTPEKQKASNTLSGKNLQENSLHDVEVKQLSGVDVTEIDAVDKPEKRVVAETPETENEKQGSSTLRENKGPVSDKRATVTLESDVSNLKTTDTLSQTVTDDVANGENADMHILEDNEADSKDTGDTPKQTESNGVFSAKERDIQEQSTVNGNKDVENVNSVENTEDSRVSDLDTVDTLSKYVIDEDIGSDTEDDTNNDDAVYTEKSLGNLETTEDETEIDDDDDHDDNGDDDDGEEEEEEVDDDDGVNSDTYLKENVIENGSILRSLTTNTTNENPRGKQSIPFGICWSFGCFRSEVFGRVGAYIEKQKGVVKFKQKHNAVDKSEFSVEKCHSKTVCYIFCYLYFTKTHSMLNYMNSSQISHIETVDYEKDDKIKHLKSNHMATDVKVDEENEIVKNPLNENSMEKGLPYKLQNENEYVRSPLKEQTYKITNGDTTIAETENDKQSFDEKSKDDTENRKSTDKSTHQIRKLEQKKSTGEKEVAENNKGSNDKIMPSVQNVDDTDTTNSMIQDRVNEKENTVNAIEKAYTNYKDEHQEYIKETQSGLSLDEFEKLIHQKTSDYSHKIQSLELMIVNLEKQLLLEQMNKQNHSSTYTRLENLVLKLENDLLRMNKYYQNLRDDTEAMQKKQNNYLELAYKQESENEHSNLPDKSTEQFEVITKQQSKIAELTEILNNQSHAIHQLKHRHESLEEQNRMLHQMVMNQTIFMTSIIQTVQDLSEQNSKNKQDMFELKQKLDSALDSNKKLEAYIEKSKQTSMLDTIESFASDTKIQNQKSDEKQTPQQNLDTINATEDFLTKWCPVKKHTCPACYYNSFMITNCLPYRTLFWLNCKGSCKTQNNFLPKSPDVKDNTTEEDSPENTQSVKITEHVEKEIYSPTNIDMATIDVKSETHEEKDTVNRYEQNPEFLSLQNENIQEKPRDENSLSEKDIKRNNENHITQENSPSINKESVNDEEENSESLKTNDDSKIHTETKHQEKPIDKKGIDTKDINSIIDNHITQEKSVESLQQQAENEESLKTIIKTDMKMNTKLHGEKQTSSPPVHPADLPIETSKDDSSLSANDILINNGNQIKQENSQAENKESVLKNDMKMDSKSKTNSENTSPSNSRIELPTETQGIAASTKKDPTLSNSEGEIKGRVPNEHVPAKSDIRSLDGEQTKNKIKNSDKSKEDASKQIAEQSTNQRVSTNEHHIAESPKIADSQTTPNEAQAVREKVVDTKANTNTDPTQETVLSAKDEKNNKASTSKSDKKKKSDSKPKKMEPINIGKEKQKEAKDCYEIKKRGSRGDGIYKIRPLGSNRVIEVFCDMKKGGWTLIQKRHNGNIDFFLGWEDYKKGFGSLYGEHWLGNDALHALTNQDYYKLRVELMDWDKNKKYAEFGYFLVEGEEEGYRLHIEEYSGDAGDGLTKHNGNKFSTKDVDNDKVVKEFGGSCANRFHGAGWYYKCYASNLNGKYYSDGKIPEKQFDGITWKPWTGPNYSIKKVVMKVRPASAND